MQNNAKPISKSFVPSSEFLCQDQTTPNFDSNSLEKKNQHLNPAYRKVLLFCLLWPDFVSWRLLAYLLRCAYPCYLQTVLCNELK